MSELPGKEKMRMMDKKRKIETATFAAGCFWGVQMAFDKFRGIISTNVGYTGGNFKNPSYRDVCSGKTRHVEAIIIEFNPKIISYENLLLRRALSLVFPPLLGDHVS